MAQTQIGSLTARDATQWPGPAQLRAPPLGLPARAPSRDPSPVLEPSPDDLSREVYCVLGLPIDAIELGEALRRIRAAAKSGTPFFLSTPNLNFLINSLADPEFRESLLLSDLCPADGMPIVWIARLAGIPIKQRVAGSDIFESLKEAKSLAQRLTVFLLGGQHDVAASACVALNAGPGAVRCVGSMNPGYGDVEDLSSDAIIDAINASNADFLNVALGAAKGQAWLVRNHRRLRVPVRAHLGAVINFQAGSVERAPALLRKAGLEWLWRIKEEPHLWTRYWRDGCVLLRLLLTRVLPLVIHSSWHTPGRHRRNLRMETCEHRGSVVVKLAGVATSHHAAAAIAEFRHALPLARERVIVDVSGIRAIDARFLGLLLMVRKHLNKRRARLEFVGASRAIKRTFRLNGLGFLLSTEQAA